MKGPCHLLAALLLASCTAVLADDTDIYLNPGFDPEDEPMVMFSIDFTPDLGRSLGSGGDDARREFFEARLGENDPDIPQDRWTLFDVIRLAFKVVLNDVSDVRVGLMLNHDRDNNCAGPGQQGCSNGGYIARRFRSVNEEGAVQEFTDILSAMPIPGGNLSHPYQGAELFFEFFRYLTGQRIYNAHNGWKDYASKDNETNLNNEHPEFAWDRNAQRQPDEANRIRYRSPLETASECAKIFTVNLMAGAARQDADSNSAIAAPPDDKVEGGLGVNPGTNNTFRNVIDILHQTDLGNGEFGQVPWINGKQNVTSYFLITPRFINQTTEEYATAGGTGRPLPLSEDPEELVNTLLSILGEILSISTTFVSASVPVNVFNRAEIVDNVYFALFQAETGPRWAGNIKKLVLKETTAPDGSQDTFLVDADERPAIGGDGRIRFDALTFWTDPAGRDLTAHDPSVGLFAGRDGRHVNRGGGGQQIPGYLAGDPGEQNSEGKRRLYFRDGATLGNLDATATVAAKIKERLGAADDGEALSLLRYIRGYDETANPDAARDWLMGDPMHSRPLPLNYGGRGAGFDEDNPAIYIAFGSNDGFFRMVRNTTAGGDDDGSEVWAFMPDEPMAIQKRLRDQTSADGPPHPYGVDGAPAALFQDVDADGVPDKVWIYFGLRRGGSAYYALDISDPEGQPVLLWHINAGDSDYGDFGMTFSRPQVGKVRRNGDILPVVIFSGGYDGNKDYYDHDALPDFTPTKNVGTDDNAGTVIYVVDAETGDRIWKGTHPDLVDSIPSDLTIADTSGDGVTDRILFGDSGGNVWRADLAGDDENDWSIHQLAKLGRHWSNNKFNDRRFFHAPDLVQTRDSEGNPYDAIIIGSGDRADPLDKASEHFEDLVTRNYLYVLRDYNTRPLTKTEKEDGGLTGALPLEHDDIADITDCPRGVGDDACTLDLGDGWRLELEIVEGEKSLSTPLTAAGTIFFTTYLPPPPRSLDVNNCGPREGSGALYAVRLADGRPRFNFDVTDDSPDGDPTSKTDRYTRLDAGGIPAEPVYIGNGKILTGGRTMDIGGGMVPERTFWRRRDNNRPLEFCN